MYMDKLYHAYQTVLLAYENSLLHQMPVSPYREFHLWALSVQNPGQELWTQVIGIPQFASLTTALLGPLVSDSEWATLADYSSLMNTYLIYETVSDNLAIGLEDLNKSEWTRNLQRNVLYHFNNAMIACMEDDADSTVDEMADAIPMLDRLSCFEHSLTCEEQISVANEFLAYHPSLEIKDLEFGVWPGLIANIESCLAVKTALESYPLGGMLRKGLVWRYQAVNRLFDAAGMPLAQLADVSTRSILVIPVLTFYISVLTEIIRPTPLLHRATEMGKLAKAIYSAAMLVRLLNDFGTQLAVSDSHHAFLLGMLTECLERTHGQQATLSDLLLDLSDEVPFLTRIRKDILYGEFNVCLNDLRHEVCTPETITAFGQRLTYFTGLYQEHRTRVENEVATITELMQDDLVSRLIVRFVQFHENLYDNPFDSQAGDYATKPDTSTMFQPEGQD
jgi:hypothetical protein